MFVSERFIGWQERVLGALAPRFDAKSRTFAGDTAAAVLEAAKQVGGCGVARVCGRFLSARRGSEEFASSTCI